MKIEDFNIKVPWWARLIGEYRRWQSARRRIKRRAREAEIPAFQGSVIGETRMIFSADHESVEPTHRWDCYETPSGERTARFTNMRPRGIAALPDGADHPVHAELITPWLNGRIDIDWRRSGMRDYRYVHRNR